MDPRIGFAVRVPALRSGMTDGRLDWFRLAAWLPPLVLAWALARMAAYEGWGRWSAAPLLLVSVLLSVPLTITGALRLRAERADGRIRAGTLVSTAVAAAPLAWLLWRLAVSR